MPTHVRVAFVLLAQALFPSSLYGQQADWTPTAADLARLASGAVLVDADVAPDDSQGAVRAVVQVHASPERVFRTLTDCAEALRYVPHLRRCSVLESATDGSWQVIEQEIDYGWLMPRARYVFRAEYERFARIRFDTVRGDFRENRGVWEFRRTRDGGGTLVSCHIHVVPRFYVPRWMVRATLRRDLPALMQGLRARAEAGSAAVAPTRHPAGAASPGPSAGQRSP